ncbi:murein L,D-transpeptidase catalytic domain family protein [Hymenobacter sp. BT175]|uniref:murein L,D-transpeptidase catalytic domain family protein n=1 Tax=Hymenobacter translucens TaxID=2886507 RepID=UPI001D0EFFD5|nr:murein L,D-transpeptidase catalytic domain family protein [Hymenobacter translucens]MCC2548358.1 murein L,D-transpeptidase catalytic domain family protein [Hymenobacter translucens]
MTKPGTGWKRQLAVLGLAVAACQRTAETASSALPNVPAMAAVDTTRAAIAVDTPRFQPDSTALTPVPDVTGVPDSLRQAIQALHAALGPDAAELRPAVLEQACVGYLVLRQQRKASQPGVLAVADMDLPSTTPRLWVLDLRQGRVLHRSLVAHGRGSGKLRARRFSNTIKSACTSLGFYRTAGTYAGIHGYSRQLQGLDQGQNSNAESRYVVLHAADYASPRYIEQHGQLGYSRGCPALPPEQYKAIISTVRKGSVLLISGPGIESRWLKGEAAARRFSRLGWN